MLIVQRNLLLFITVIIIFLYVHDFILLRPENLCVILARHNEIPEDDIFNVETCRSMLFVIIVFDVIVQSLVKLYNKECTVLVSK